MKEHLVSAWRTIVPRDDLRHGPLSTWLVVLTAVTGIVDAFSYLALGHVFVANMTGNVVFIGFSVAGAPGFSVGASLLAIAAFLVGALAGGHLSHRHAAHRGRLLLRAVSLQLAAVSVALLIAIAADGHLADPSIKSALIIALGVGLGIQNAAVRFLAVPDLTTTVLTLTLTGIAADSRAAGGNGSALGRRGVSVLAMFTGALTGGVLTLHAAPWTALALAETLLAVVALVALRLARSSAPWSAASA